MFIYGKRGDRPARDYLSLLLAGYLFKNKDK